MDASAAVDIALDTVEGAAVELDLETDDGREEWEVLVRRDDG